MPVLNKRHEIFGIGCLINIVGVLLGLFIFIFIHWLLGLLVLLGALIVGSLKSRKFICSNCEEQVHDPDAPICPHCGVSFD